VILGFSIPSQVAFSGFVNGATYGIMAVGIILVYRSARVINLAVAEMGGFAAALLARMVINWKVPYWPSFAVCALVGAAIGWIIDRVVIRRLFDAPRVIVMVATIGVAQLLLFGQAVLPQPSQITSFPAPLSGSWTILGVQVQGAHVAILVIVPLLTVALGLFLNRTKQGTAIRAAASNPDAARLAGVSPKRMSSLVWVLAGLLAAVGSILSAPITTTTSADVLTLGPGLLVRVLVAAVIARMSSPLVALATGLAIGVGEAVLFYNQPNNHGILDLALLVVLLLSLLPMARRRVLSGAVEGGWSFAPRARALPAAVADAPWARWLPRAGYTCCLLVAFAPVVLVHGAADQQLWSRVVLSALVALSLTVLTGWSGQLSLGQIAFVGLGAMSTAALVTRGLGFAPALAVAALVGCLSAVVVGVPALRIPGLFLAVTTLAFAVATGSWLLSRSWFVGADQTITMPRAVVGSFSLAPERTYYLLCLLALVLCVIAVSRLRRSGFGRSLVAVRDNERSLAALGLSPARAKVTAFAVSGALAGFAGGLLGGLYITFGPDRFSPADSLQAVAIVVVGGLSSIGGAIVGALFVVGIPVLFDDNAKIALLTSGVGILVVLLVFPGGLVAALTSARDRILERLAGVGPSGRAEADGPELAATPRASAEHVPATVGSQEPGSPTLAVSALTVHFGRDLVVDDVSLDVRAGEIVALIGTNGAGKTTIMNAVGGFVPSRGTVQLLGGDVTELSAWRRARSGLGRTFQGAELFGELTVRDTVTLATEVAHRAGVPSIVVGLPRARRAERAKRAAADDVIDSLGLGPVAARYIDELSTGTRRVVELACLRASGARVLCLDEPTAGLAQREAEAFVPTLVRLREELDASVLLIEHDMSVAMAVSDRMYCLEAGTIIGHGRPDELRVDPRVIESYLGGGVTTGDSEKTGWRGASAAMSASVERDVIEKSLRTKRSEGIER
jgi:ABC-type branched-subunit amino acid transport system ATPase component/ABC-type branched-subunit amino acid transport system permease subunit